MKGTALSFLLGEKILQNKVNSLLTKGEIRNKIIFTLQNSLTKAVIRIPEYQGLVINLYSRKKGQLFAKFDGSGIYANNFAFLS